MSVREERSRGGLASWKALIHLVEGVGGSEVENTLGAHSQLQKALVCVSPFPPVGGNGLIHPVEERAALPVPVQGTGKEPPGLSVGIVALKH